MIETKISPRKIALMVIETLGIAFISGLNLAFILIGIEYFTNGSWVTVEINQLVLLFGMISLYPFIVYFRIRRYKKMECWSINGNYLYRGKDKEFKVDLREIEIAILGVPHIKIKNVLLKFLNPREIAISRVRVVEFL